MVPVTNLTPKRLNEFKNDNVNKCIEAIITSDGTYYPCITTHPSLIEYLKNNGVNLAGSIRITQDGNYVALSSCYGYCFYDVEHLSSDKVIAISNAQAHAVVNFYFCVKEVERGKDYTIQKILERSSNLGWCLYQMPLNDPIYYSDELAEANIKSIQKAIIEQYPHYENRADLQLDGFVDKVTDSNRILRPSAREAKTKFDNRQKENMNM